MKKWYNFDALWTENETLGAKKSQEVRIVEEWARIPQSIIDRFVRTFKRKLAACLSALGKHFHLPKGDTS